MNYRHAYHAGGFADVCKHIVLVTVLDAMLIKASAITYLETHAGRGSYSLQSTESEKKREYETGILRLLDYAKDNPPPKQIQHYIDSVYAVNPPNTLCFYPGSPLIAQKCLREQDKLVLCELHPQEYRYLKENLTSPHTAIHHMDGYLGAKAFLPPKTPRGLLHIDPPFEKSDEFQHIEATIEKTLKHWRQAPIMIWHPIKDRKVIEKFHRRLQNNAPCFIMDFFIPTNMAPTALLGCGIVLVNPPWAAKEALENEILPYLKRALTLCYSGLANHPNEMDSSTYQRHQ